MTTPRPFILLDRDGTIIHEKHYLSDPAQVELLQNAAKGMKKMRDLGYGLVVVTNQAGIGRGYFSEAQMHAVNRRMCELLAAAGARVDGIYFCRDAPGAPSTCRKPLPGMALSAAHDHNIDLARSVVIGDKAIDIGLGKATGSRTGLVRTGYGIGEIAHCEPDFVADDLLDAARWLEAHART